MGEPIKTSLNKSPAPDPSLERLRAIPECRKGEIPEIGVDKQGEWKWACVLDPGPLGGLIGSGFVCGDRGGPPCDWGTGLIYPKDLELSEIEKRRNLAPPPPHPPSQFQPPAPSGLKEIITGRAEYRCRTGFPFVDYWTITQGVSIPGIPGDTEEKTRARLEQAARDLAETIGGCRQVEFKGLQSTPPTSPEPKTKERKEAEAADPCRPGGKWEHQKICWR